MVIILLMIVVIVMEKIILMKRVDYFQMETVTVMEMYLMDAVYVEAMELMRMRMEYVIMKMNVLENMLHGMKILIMMDGEIVMEISLLHVKR